MKRTYRLSSLIALFAMPLAACNAQEDPTTSSRYNATDTFSRNAKARIFVQNDQRMVPADFEQVNLSLDLDRGAQKGVGTAVIRFQALEEGFPYFLLNATPLEAQLDGEPVSIDAIQDPKGLNTLRKIRKSVEPGSSHELVLKYQLLPANVTFRPSGVGFVTSMADIASGNFFENYGPANFEDDQFKMTFRVSLLGVSSTHQAFSNGTMSQLSPTSWEVDYPEYYNSSSFYFHVTDLALAVRRSTYAGLEKSIPLTVYAQDAASADSAMAKLPGLFKELESTYGPYLHDSFTAYIYGSGGMEHCGATITSVSALGHELAHSWFARGVMPSSGNSGWIDEATASWRDYDYFQTDSATQRPVSNLANFTIFERFSPSNVYVDGRRLFSQLDHLFQSSHGGLRPLLRELFGEFKTQTITTEIFQDFLETRTGRDLDSYFDRYVYGGVSGFSESVLGSRQSLDFKPAEPSASPKADGQTETTTQTSEGSERGHHPPALTQQMIEKLR